MADAITFSPEEVKYSVSIFTDIDCTYCRRLHSEIDEYLAAGIEVRYFLYPRGGPGVTLVEYGRKTCGVRRIGAMP